MTGKILAGGLDGVYLVRCVGDVRLGMSTGMDGYFEELLADGQCKSIMIDLSETRSIDSTSLGSLAKLSIISRKRLGLSPTLVSTNPDVTRVLRTMGFDEIFQLVEQPLSAFEDLDLEDRTASSMSAEGTEQERQEQMRRCVIDAHKTLMSLNGNNREAFRDLMESLHSDE